jgi:hypothetical protein
MQKLYKKTYKHCTSIDSPYNSASIDVQRYEKKESKKFSKFSVRNLRQLSDIRILACFYIFIDI